MMKGYNSARRRRLYLRSSRVSPFEEREDRRLMWCLAIDDSTVANFRGYIAFHFMSAKPGFGRVRKFKVSHLL